MAGENHKILGEVNQKNLWFPAVKIAPVWAKVNVGGQVLASLEGEVTSQDGDIICRGPDGELWTQRADTFRTKYLSSDTPPDDQGFSKHMPNPSSSRVMAAKVGHRFQVQTSYGLLSGKAGDYLLKPRDAEAEEWPESVWIVNSTIFSETYQEIEP